MFLFNPDNGPNNPWIIHYVLPIEFYIRFQVEVESCTFPKCINMPVSVFAVAHGRYRLSGNIKIPLATLRHLPLLIVMVILRKHVKIPDLAHLGSSWQSSNDYIITITQRGINLKALRQETQHFLACLLRCVFTLKLNSRFIPQLQWARRLNII